MRHGVGWAEDAQGVITERRDAKGYSHEQAALGLQTALGTAQGLNTVFGLHNMGPEVKGDKVWLMTLISAQGRDR